MNTTTTEELNAGWRYAANVPTKDGWYQVKTNSPRIEQALYVVSVGDWFLNNRVVYPKVWREIPAAACDRRTAWISVHEQMPNKGETVLCLMNNVRLFGSFDGNEWVSEGGYSMTNNVTHWQPVPLPPQPDVAQCNDGWIGVYDQMPNIGENVTLLCSNTRFTGHFDGTAWQVNGGCIVSGVTHWQRIPPLLQRPDGWLDLNDRIPPNRHPVLCLTDDGPIVGYRDCEIWFATLGDKAVRVKAWRELPQQPQQQHDCCKTDYANDGFSDWWLRHASELPWTSREEARRVWTAARTGR